MRICNSVLILIFDFWLVWVEFRDLETFCLVEWCLHVLSEKVLGLHSDFDFGEDLYSMKSNICTFTLRRHTK